MILKFPDLATLQLALTSGVVPPAVSQSPAVAGFSDSQAVWVETSSALGRAVQNELKRLGVQICRANGAATSTEVTCWLELLPLQPEPTFPSAGGFGGMLPPEQTPVLFEVADGEQIARLANEMLRLGNDRQGFRWLEGNQQNPGRALLRVVGPPYYSLLRALDYHRGASRGEHPPEPSRGRPRAPVAYIEQAPGVWVEVGHNHPLANRIKPPRGKILLLRPPRYWAVLDDGHFRDVYEVLEFTLPNAPSSLHEGELKTRLQVPLSLKPGGSPDNPELWVLTSDPANELNHFVQNNDDELLRRLAFAIGEKDGTQTIVVRVRQSKLPPPVLVLHAQGYRHHLKLPNLFLPVGTGLHPPLRRDKVRELFAEDISQVNWLAPGPNGTFRPQSLPEDAFRPLTDWVDYVLDHDREALQAWVQAAQFDFEPFTCNEDGSPRPKKSERAEKDRVARGPKSSSRGPKESEATQASIEEAENQDKAVAAELDAFGLVEKIEPSELQKELRDLEQRFLDLEGPLDLPQRLALWPEMAARYAALSNYDDAGLCWLHALWEKKAANPAWAWTWLRTEALASVPRYEVGHKAPRSWLTQYLNGDGRPVELPPDDLDRLLKLKEPSIKDVLALAAYLAWSAGRTPPPVALVERLQPLHRFLEAHERLVPVRAVWLAWTNLARLSGGDELGLARARDRLLERLFHNGLRPEQDLPGFLRFGGTPTSQRFHAVRQWLSKLADLAQKWVKDNAGTEQKPPMDAYVDLIFSFGLARLGEADAARGLLNRATSVLKGKDEAHTFLLEAYRYRITQALDSRHHAGPLPEEQMATLKAIPTLQSYIVDRLRKHSYILEPDQRIDPYRKWGAKISELDDQLTQLVDVTDRMEIAARVQKLLRAVPTGDDGREARARILKTALEVAPRIGEEFAKEMLDAALKVYRALPEPEDSSQLHDRATFLEKGLFVAAHFDQVGHIHTLVARFEQLLEAQRGVPAVAALEALAGQCFRGLRKLGMRDQIDRLLGRMAELVLDGKDVESLEPAGLQALLLVAGEYYFFGRDAHAEPILQRARALLTAGNLQQKEQNALACAYGRTVAQAPVAIAQKRLEEIFTNIKGVRDTFTTSTHYFRSQFDVIEAVVLAVVSDDFTLGSQARRWLDEDEFLVRRRIHRDVRAALGRG
jgi:hypothetical protein